MSNRRRGRVGGNSQTSNSAATEQIHSLLDEKSQQAGLIVADKFQSQVLMSALVAINSGYVGSQTLQLLEQLKSQTIDPFLNWGALPESEQLPSLPESNG